MALPEGRYCPYCGEGLRRVPVGGLDLPEEALKPACRDCGYVHLDAPLPVAAAIVERPGEVLLVRPEEELAEGRWFPLAGLPVWPEGWPLREVFGDYR